MAWMDERLWSRVDKSLHRKVFTPTINGNSATVLGLISVGEAEKEAVLEKVFVENRKY